MAPPPGAAAASRGRWWWAAVTVVAVFVVSDVVLAHGVAEPATYGPAFAAVMNLATALRLATMFVAPVVAWPWARSHGATVAGALVVGMAGPAAYAVSAVWRGLSYYPPVEALYYGTNPLVVGAVAGSLGCCAGAEWGFRRWRRRRAQGRGGAAVAPAAHWWLLALFAAGQAAVYGLLFWDGGIHWFYVWIAGYRALFT